MVILKILDEEFDETIENISLGSAFSMIEDYCIEHMIDEPKVSDIVYDADRMAVYLDDVTFEIEDYHGEERKNEKVDI